MIFRGRYGVLFSFCITFVFCSFLVRAGLLLVSLPKTQFSLTGVLWLYGLGFAYDCAVALLMVALFNFYLLVLPSKWSNSKVHRLITYTWLFLMLLISFFSFFAELTFWQEFESRFNFIAVDYLIYTYEVINNINESYPLPVLITGVVAMDILVIWVFFKRKIFKLAFQDHMPVRKRLVISGCLLLLMISLPLVLSNTFAEKGSNRYQNELSKAGIFFVFCGIQK
ncbi:MAG: hypothetical protein MUP99_01970 [Pedobacter sp.]|nr:hypothetical protein [Pedobacter sp.]